MSAMGLKRTCAVQYLMSALCQKRTLAEMTFDKTERPPRGGLSEIRSGTIKPISHRTRTDQCRPQG